MRAPAPMVTKAADRRVCAQLSRVGATCASRWIPGSATAGGGEQLDRVRERQIRVRRAQHARTAPRLGALAEDHRRRARRRADARRNLGLAKKVRSPARACSMPATPWMSISPSPSRRQSRRAARSRSFKAPSIPKEVGGWRREVGGCGLEGRGAMGEERGARGEVTRKSRSAGRTTRSARAGASTRHACTCSARASGASLIIVRSSTAVRWPPPSTSPPSDPAARRAARNSGRRCGRRSSSR